MLCISLYKLTRKGSNRFVCYIQLQLYSSCILYTPLISMCTVCKTCIGCIRSSTALTGICPGFLRKQAQSKLTLMMDKNVSKASHGKRVCWPEIQLKTSHPVGFVWVHPWVWWRPCELVRLGIPKLEDANEAGLAEWNPKPVCVKQRSSSAQSEMVRIGRDGS
jgi:hypothetical protein